MICNTLVGVKLYSFVGFMQVKVAQLSVQKHYDTKTPWQKNQIDLILPVQQEQHNTTLCLFTAQFLLILLLLLPLECPLTKAQFWTFQTFMSKMNLWFNLSQQHQLACYVCREKRASCSAPLIKTSPKKPVYSPIFETNNVSRIFHMQGSDKVNGK